MRRVFKYLLHDRVTVVDLPLAFEVLTAMYNPEDKSIYVYIDVPSTEEEFKKSVIFEAFPTGADHPFEMIYINSVRTVEGLVWHIYRH